MFFLDRHGKMLEQLWARFPYVMALGVFVWIAIIMFFVFRSAMRYVKRLEELGRDE